MPLGKNPEGCSFPKQMIWGEFESPIILLGILFLSK